MSEEVRSLVVDEENSGLLLILHRPSATAHLLPKELCRQNGRQAGYNHIHPSNGASVHVWEGAAILTLSTVYLSDSV